MIHGDHEKLTRLCKCGHQRGAHVDAYQKCDECDCKAYDGPHDTLAPPPYCY